MVLMCFLPAPGLAEGCYLLFDLPGQVELFTLHSSLRRILEVLTRRWQYRLTTVQLVDAHLCRWVDESHPIACVRVAGTVSVPAVNSLPAASAIKSAGKVA